MKHFYSKYREQKGARSYNFVRLTLQREGVVTKAKRSAGAILLGGVLGPLALMYGLTVTTASTASLLLNVEAVFTALIAWFLFRKNFDRRIALGMLAIVAGAVLLAWSPAKATSVSMGALFIVAACACWALDSNLTRKTSTSDAVLIAGLKGNRCRSGEPDARAVDGPTLSRKRHADRRRRRWLLRLWRQPRPVHHRHPH